MERKKERGNYNFKGKDDKLSDFFLQLKCACVVEKRCVCVCMYFILSKRVYYYILSIVYQTGLESCLAISIILQPPVTGF